MLIGISSMFLSGAVSAGAPAPISYVGSATATNGAVTFPTHATGDLILRLGVRNAATLPSAPSSPWAEMFTPFTTTGLSIHGYWKIAESAAETDPLNFTGRHIVAIYHNGMFIAGSGATLNGTGTTGSIPAASSAVAGAWLFGYLGAQTSQSNWVAGVTPDGCTNVNSNSTNPVYALSHSAGPLASFAQKDGALTSATWAGASWAIRPRLASD